MINWIKSHLLLTVSILAVFLLVVASFRACDLSKKSAELKGKYEALEKEFTQYRKTAELQITALNEEVESRNKHIKELTNNIGDITKKIGDKDETIADLEKEYDTLKQDVAKISNLKKQVATWKEKFTLAEEVIAKKDRIIFNLNQKYEAQLTITKKYKKLYQDQLELNDILEKRVRNLTADLHKQQFGGTIKNGLIVTAGIVIIYGLVAK